MCSGHRYAAGFWLAVILTAAISFPAFAGPSSDGPADVLFAAAVRRAKSGEWRSAAASFESALAESGPSCPGYFGLAVSRARLGDFASAAESYEDALRRLYEDESGEASLRSKRFVLDALISDSLESSRTGRLLMPGKYDIEFCAGASNFFAGDYSRAAEAFANSVAAKKSVPALHWRARSLERCGKDAEALELLKTVASEDPEDTEVLAELWAALKKAGDANGASGVMKNIEILDPALAKKLQQAK